MEKELKKRLSGFPEVWKRVAGDKGRNTAPPPDIALMPRKGKKPPRRYE